jgi:hypothetical protein
MIQVIQRNQSLPLQIKQEFDGRPQISYNSDNCIVIRLKEGDGDILFCLNQTVSYKLIKFIKSQISDDTIHNDMPF